MAPDTVAIESDRAARSPFVHHYPRPGKAWWIVFTLFCASVFAGLDRSILGLAVDPVKHDLHISDVQISLLQGLSFSLFYATAGLFCGYISDRISRKWLLVFGLAVWTAATIAGGLATNFGMLFASRVLVGLGEATLVPVAVSTISDLFPPAKRGRPMGVYLLGQVLAGGLADLVSGAVLSTASKGGFAHLPFVGGLSGWRLIFLFCGFAGLGVVALLATISDTPRAPSAQGHAQSFTAGQSFDFLKRHWKMFTPLYLGYALGAVNFYGISAWSPMLFTRHFGLTPGQVGAMAGGAFLIAGPIATLLGGVFTDRAAERSGVRGKAWLMIVLTVAMLASAVAPFAVIPGLSIALIITSRLAFTMMSIALFGLLQDITPTSMRGFAVSISGLTNAVIGASGGPILIALATERLYRNPALVGYSIVTVCLPALIGALICFRVCRRALPRADSLATEQGLLPLR